MYVFGIFSRLSMSFIYYVQYSNKQRRLRSGNRFVIDDDLLLLVAALPPESGTVRVWVLALSCLELFPVAVLILVTLE